MGTGEAVKGKDICWGVVLTIQGLTLVHDFLPLELGNTNLVLGMQWLGSLGSMEVNWKHLTMTFRMGSSLVVLQGDSGLCKSGVPLKTMVKEIKQEGQGFLVEFGSLSTFEPASETVPNEVIGVLTQFHRVFDMPEGLPPFRGSDLAIRLINESVSINVRPYRYPHVQKNEIEHMVRDMLSANPVLSLF